MLKIPTLSTLHRMALAYCDKVDLKGHSTAQLKLRKLTFVDTSLPLHEENVLRCLEWQLNGRCALQYYTKEYRLSSYALYQVPQ